MQAIKELHLIERIKQIFILTFFIILIVFATYSLSWATSYYVDATNGNDTNSGTSEAMPWKTIAKVNSSKFEPGDNILFKKGEIWHEQLTVSSSGTLGHPISFGSYGVGNKPLISGTNIILTWTDKGSSHSATLATEPQQVFYNNIKLTKNDGKTTLVGENEWDWDSNTLYVNIGEDPHTGAVEIGQNRYGINIVAKDYIAVDSIDIKFTDLDGIKIVRSDHISITNCNVSWTYRSGIYAYGDSLVNLLTDVLIDSNTIKSCGYHGIMIEALGGSRVDNVIISRNLVDDVARSDYQIGGTGIIAWQDENGSPGSAITNLTIEYNEVKNTAKNEPSGEEDAGLGIWIDTLYPDSDSSNCIVRYNKVHHNDRVGIEIEKSKGVSVYGNLIYNNGYIGLRLRGGDGSGDDDKTPVEDTMVYNNTVYNNSVRQLWVEAQTILDVNPTVKNNTIKNNIFYGSGEIVSFERGGENDGTNGTGNVYEYNCFGSESANFIKWGKKSFFSTYDDWESNYGGNTYSVESDPIVTDPENGIFTLQLASPCIDAGIDMGLEKDLDGTIVPTGKKPDLGAFERKINYSSGISPPKNLIILSNAD